MNRYINLRIANAKRSSKINDPIICKQTLKLDVGLEQGDMTILFNPTF